MKKENKFEWDELCQQAFEEIKIGLLKPFILLAPVSDRSFILYIFHTEKVAIVLALADDLGREHPVYYLCCTMSLVK